MRHSQGLTPFRANLDGACFQYPQRVVWQLVFCAKTGSSCETSRARRHLVLGAIGARKTPPEQGQSGRRFGELRTHRPAAPVFGGEACHTPPSDHIVAKATKLAGNARAK